MSLSRRTFIVTGLAGAVALAAAGRLRGPHAPASGIARRALSADAEALFAAVVPVLLEGALPIEPQARKSALAETLTGIDTAVASLTPDAQAELRQLVSLLALPPVRFGVARVRSSWNDANLEEVRVFLDRCRNSSIKLMRAAYDALHDLTFAAWYGNAKSWPAIGYPGPPPLV